MKNATKKITAFLGIFRDKDGNEPDLMIIASLFHQYTEAYVIRHRLRRVTEE